MRKVKATVYANPLQKIKDEILSSEEEDMLQLSKDGLIQDVNNTNIGIPNKDTYSQFPSIMSGLKYLSLQEQGEARSLLLCMGQLLPWHFHKEVPVEESIYIGPTISRLLEHELEPYFFSTHNSDLLDAGTKPLLIINFVQVSM